MLGSNLKKINFAGIFFWSLISPCFAGPYVGAAIGPEGAHFVQKSHITRSVSPGAFNVIDIQKYSGIGFFGSLLAGYGWRHDRYYLAIEINGNLSSLEYQLKNDEYLNRTFARTTFTVKSSEGVSALPGFFISDNTLFYGRIAYANGRVKIQESDPTILNATKNCGGIRYGLGLRHHFAEQWTMMMDYSQINYQNLKSFVFEPFGGVGKFTKIYPNTAQVAFGLLYNFDRPSTK